MAATWWTNPDGKRFLVLRAYCAEGIDYDRFLVPMTPEYAQELLRRIEVTNRWRSEERELSWAAWWALDGEFRSADWDSELQDADGEQPPLWQAGDSDFRTDTDRLDIGDGWVEWHAYVKNTDERVHTDALERKDLEAYVRGEQPWGEYEGMTDQEERCTHTQ